MLDRIETMLRILNATYSPTASGGNAYTEASILNTMREMRPVEVEEIGAHWNTAFSAVLCHDASPLRQGRTSLEVALPDSWVWPVIAKGHCASLEQSLPTDYQILLRVSTALLETDPLDPDRWRHLANTVDGVRHLLPAPNGTDLELRILLATLAMRRRALQLAPDSYGAEREVARTCKRLEEAFSFRGLSAFAGTYLLEQTPWRRRLAEEFPGEDPPAYRFSVHLSKVAKLLLAQGNTKAALDALLERVANARRHTAGEHSTKVQRQRLSTCLTDLGNHYHYIGLDEEALAAHSEALSLDQRLVEDFPRDLASLRCVVASLTDAAIARFLFGQRPQAHSLIEQATSRVTQIGEVAPDFSELQATRDEVQEVEALIRSANWPSASTHVATTNNE